MDITYFYISKYQKFPLSVVHQWQAVLRNGGAIMVCMLNLMLWRGYKAVLVLEVEERV